MVFVSFVHDDSLECGEDPDDAAACFYSQVVWNSIDRITQGCILVVSNMPDDLSAGWANSSQCQQELKIYTPPVGQPPVYRKMFSLMFEAINKDMAEGKVLYITNYNIDYNADYKSEFAQEALKKAKILIFTGAYLDKQSLKQNIEPMIDTFLAVDPGTNKAVIMCGFEDQSSAEAQDWFNERFPQLEQTETLDDFNERFDEFLEEHDL